MGWRREPLEQARRLLSEYGAALEQASSFDQMASLERWFAIALLARNRWELDYEKRHRPEMVAVAEAGWGRTIRLASALLAPKR